MHIVPQLIVNSLIAGGIYSLVGMSFNLVYGATRFFNLGHGVIAAVGGYAVYEVQKIWHWPWYTAVVFGVLVAGLVGVIIDQLVYAPLRRRKASSMVMLVASLGVFTALQALLAILFSSQFQPLAAAYEQPTVYSFWGAAITKTQVIIIVSSVAIWFVLACIERLTLFGKAVTAVSDDMDVARIVGIPTEWIVTGVFFLGSAIVGYAGILRGFDSGIEPAMGLVLLLSGVIAAIIGGAGSIHGAIIGAFLLGFAENFGIWFIPGEWKDTIALLVLVVFLIFRPQGIVKR